MVTMVTNSAELDHELIKAGDKLVVANFYADWCSPCRKIAPFVLQLSQEMNNVVFIKIDRDRSEALAQKYRVIGLPTFIFFKKGARAETLESGSETLLKDVIHRLNG